MNNLFNIFNALNAFGTIKNAADNVVSTGSNLVNDVNQIQHFKNIADRNFSKDENVKKLANDRIKCNSEINSRNLKLFLNYIIIPVLIYIIILVIVQICPEEINIEFGKYNKIDLKIFKNLLIVISAFMPCVFIFGFFKLWRESIRAQAATLKINNDSPIDTTNCMKYLNVNI